MAFASGMNVLLKRTRWLTVAASRSGPTTIRRWSRWDRTGRTPAAAWLSGEPVAWRVPPGPSRLTSRIAHCAAVALVANTLVPSTTSRRPPW